MRNTLEHEVFQSVVYEGFLVPTPRGYCIHGALWNAYKESRISHQEKEHCHLILQNVTSGWTVKKCLLDSGVIKERLDDVTLEIFSNWDYRQYLK